RGRRNFHFTFCLRLEGTQTEAAVGDPFAPFIKSGEEMVGAKGATTTKILKFFLPIWISACGGLKWGTKVLRFVLTLCVNKTGTRAKD
ncbi:hypothetical protein HYW94_02905, partial [Candidatus Uhrbacteria bacterium]|nr:hypothetical protein [Candidatus Uhrbacteria bacterium]